MTDKAELHPPPETIAAIALLLLSSQHEGGLWGTLRYLPRLDTAESGKNSAPWFLEDSEAEFES